VEPPFGARLLGDRPCDGSVEGDDRKIGAGDRFRIDRVEPGLEVLLRRVAAEIDLDLPLFEDLEDRSADGRVGAEDRDAMQSQLTGPRVADHQGRDAVLLGELELLKGLSLDLLLRAQVQAAVQLVQSRLQLAVLTPESLRLGQTGLEVGSLERHPVLHRWINLVRGRPPSELKELEC
jgi:hypothetical protein